LASLLLDELATQKNGALASVFETEFDLGISLESGAKKIVGKADFDYC